MNFTRNFYTMPKKTSTVRKPPRIPVKRPAKLSKKRGIVNNKTHTLVLPAHWELEIKTRQLGKSSGQMDKYFISPSGRKFRSIVQMNTEIAKSTIPPQYYRMWYINGSKAFASNVEWSDKDCQDEYERPESDYY